MLNADPRPKVHRRICGDAGLLIATMISSIAIPNSILSVLMFIIPVSDVTFTLALLAPMSSILLFLAPISSVRTAMTMCSSANLPTPGFRIQLFCNLLATAYGLAIRNLAVIVPNQFGMLCQICWLAYAIFIDCKSQKRPMNWLFFILEFVVACNVGLAAFTLLSLRSLATIITASQIILCAQPLSQLSQILRTKNRDSIDTPITVMLIINNGLWAAYAGLLRDPVLFVPSLVGYLLSVFQVILILWCQGTLPFDLSHLTRIIQIRPRHILSRTFMPQKIGKTSELISEDVELLL
eukprot:GEMP01043171.1.p1 GENE.GEMP01043171.1~~GEMP01043171.1.p1  ORF type:complete len:295 (+),score=32.19 GEMP01043171.1:506-1390(+)